MNKTNGNGTIGTLEKRELAKLINVEFNEIIEQLQQEIRFTEDHILDEAEEKFGVKVINQEIKNLEEKISLLKEQKEQIGFDSYGKGFKKTWDKNNNNVVDSRTKAGRFYYLRMNHQSDIRNLKQQRDARLKKLWLINDREEVKLLIQEKIDIKLIETQLTEDPNA